MYPFVFILSYLLPWLLYLMIRWGAKHLKRHLVATTWERTKRYSYAFGSIFLVCAIAHRLYYFHDEMMYESDRHLNQEYASQIETETYLMSEPNLIELFEGKSPNPDRREVTSEEAGNINFPSSTDPRSYLVIRIKNKGDRVAWGILNYVYGDKIIRPIDIPPLPANMKEYKNIVLLTQPQDRFGEMFFSFGNKVSPYPQLKSTWLKLFTQKGD